MTTERWWELDNLKFWKIAKINETPTIYFWLQISWANKNHGQLIENINKERKVIFAHTCLQWNITMVNAEKHCLQMWKIHLVRVFQSISKFTQMSSLVSRIHTDNLLAMCKSSMLNNWKSTKGSKNTDWTNHQHKTKNEENMDSNDGAWHHFTDSRH